MMPSTNPPPTICTFFQVYGTDEGVLDRVCAANRGCKTSAAAMTTRNKPPKRFPCMTLPCKTCLLLELHNHFVPTVVHRAIRLGRKRESCLFRLRYKHQLESALRQHLRERALAFANGERLTRIIPAERNPRKQSFFVVVGQPVVLVESKLTVGTLINEQRNGIRFFL